MSTLVPDHERAVVQAKAARLRYEAGRRAEPGISARLRGRVCFVVAAIAPDLSHRQLSLLARYARWTLLLDDRLDAADPDQARLDRLERAVAAVIGGDRPAPGDPCLDLLAAVLDDLVGLADLDRFAAELRDAVAAGVAHARLSRAVARGEAAPPTAEQYLPVAARSVNYRSFAYLLLAVGAAGLAAPVPVDRALRHAARAVRLGNDLRSRSRDRAESTLNILQLRTAAGRPVTPPAVHAQIDREVRAHDAALAGLAGAGSPAGPLTRSLRLSVGLYRLTDLR